MTELIATLVAPHGLAPGDISAVCDAVGGMADALIDDVACQIAFDGDAVEARATLEALLPHADLIIRPTDASLPCLLIADMDSTMITVECIDELADYAGLKPEIAAITERARRRQPSVAIPAFIDRCMSRAFSVTVRLGHSDSS